MRIICIEEHVSDAATGKASGAEMGAIAPYMKDVGAYHDDPSRVGNRPGLTNFPEALAIAARGLDDERVAAMDADRIDMQVISYSSATQLAPAAQEAALARAANDSLAAQVARYPGRFGGFCTLPWQDVDAAVAEAERCATELGYTATMLNGFPEEGRMVDDAKYAPILAKLADLSMALYLHPGPPQPAVQHVYYAGYSPELTGRLSLFGWGWHNEAGIQVVRLILSKVLDTHRNLNLISGHWGEMVPFFLQRMDDTMPPAVTGLSRTISETYRDQVWVTPSGMLNLPHFKFIHEALGAARIIFSIDYPYLTMTGGRDWLEALPVTDEERHAIAHGNAEALLRIPPA